MLSKMWHKAVDTEGGLIVGIREREGKDLTWDSEYQGFAKSGKESCFPGAAVSPLLGVDLE